MIDRTSQNAADELDIKEMEEIIKKMATYFERKFGIVEVVGREASELGAHREQMGFDRRTARVQCVEQRKDGQPEQTGDENVTKSGD